MIKVLVAIFKEVLPVLLFDTTSCLPYYCKNSTLSLREVSKYGVFSGPYFHVFGLNVKIYSVFSPNTGTYGPEKLRIWTLFTLCIDKASYLTEP